MPDAVLDFIRVHCYSTRFPKLTIYWNADKTPNRHWVLLLKNKDLRNR